jgi:hypothetical protein
MGIFLGLEAEGDGLCVYPEATSMVAIVADEERGRGEVGDEADNFPLALPDLSQTCNDGASSDTSLLHGKN